METEAKGTAPQAPLIEFSLRIPWPQRLSTGAGLETRARAGLWIWVLLAAGLGLRLFLATMPGFSYDMGSFEAWSNRLADNGPWHFYAPGYFADYAPGYLYVLWFIGKLNQAFGFSQGTLDYIIKLPGIVADLASAYLLYLFLERQRLEARLAAAAIYLLFPAGLLIGAVWGQVDSLATFFLMLSLYWIARRKHVLGTLAYVVSFMIKPQLIAALPFLAFWIIKENPPRWQDVRELGMRLPVPPPLWWKLAGVGVAVLLVMTIPFFPHDPYRAVFGGLGIPGAGSGTGLIEHLRNSANFYKYNSLNAYNMWGTAGFFKPDTGSFLGIAHPTLGILLFIGATVAVLFSLRRRSEDWALALGTALCLLAFFLFLSRMHERYLFPVFLPLLAACVLTGSWALWTGFIALGVLHFFNVYYAYSYYPFALPPQGTSPREPFMKPLYDWLANADFWSSGMSTNQLLSWLTTLFFPMLLVAAYVLALVTPDRAARAERVRPALQSEGT